MINFERRDRFLGLFRDLVENLWSFVFAMGFIFFLRASKQIMSGEYIYLLFIFVELWRVYLQSFKKEIYMEF